jgi:hypothetical protein
VPELALAVLFSPFLLTAGVLLWGGAATLMDVWRRRHPDIDLEARVEMFSPTIGDEAEAWLRRQRHQTP